MSFWVFLFFALSCELWWASSGGTPSLILVQGSKWREWLLRILKIQQASSYKCLLSFLQFFHSVVSFPNVLPSFSTIYIMFSSFVLCFFFGSVASFLILSSFNSCSSFLLFWFNLTIRGLQYESWLVLSFGEFLNLKHWSNSKVKCLFKSSSSCS